MPRRYEDYFIMPDDGDARAVEKLRVGLKPRAPTPETDELGIIPRPVKTATGDTVGFERKLLTGKTEFIPNPAGVVAEGADILRKKGGYTGLFRGEPETRAGAGATGTFRADVPPPLATGKDFYGGTPTPDQMSMTGMFPTLEKMTGKTGWMVNAGENQNVFQFYHPELGYRRLYQDSTTGELGLKSEADMETVTPVGRGIRRTGGREGFDVSTYVPGETVISPEQWRNMSAEDKAIVNRANRIELGDRITTKEAEDMGIEPGADFMILRGGPTAGYGLVKKGGYYGPGSFYAEPEGVPEDIVPTQQEATLVYPDGRMRTHRGYGVHRTGPVLGNEQAIAQEQFLMEKRKAGVPQYEEIVPEEMSFGGMDLRTYINDIKDPTERLAAIVSIGNLKKQMADAGITKEQEKYVGPLAESLIKGRGAESAYKGAVTKQTTEETEQMKRMKIDPTWLTGVYQLISILGPDHAISRSLLGTLEGLGGETDIGIPGEDEELDIIFGR